MAKSDAPLKRRQSTELAKDKHDPGITERNHKGHPLAQDLGNAKDPKQKGKLTGSMGQEGTSTKKSPMSNDRDEY